MIAYNLHFANQLAMLKANGFQVNVSVE